MFNRYIDPEAEQMLDEPVHPVHEFNPLVNIETSHAAQETRV